RSMEFTINLRSLPIHVSLGKMDRLSDHHVSDDCFRFWIIRNHYHFIRLGYSFRNAHFFLGFFQYFSTHLSSNSTVYWCNNEQSMASAHRQYRYMVYYDCHLAAVIDQWLKFVTLFLDLRHSCSKYVSQSSRTRANFFDDENGRWVCIWTRVRPMDQLGKRPIW